MCFQREKETLVPEPITLLERKPPLQASRRYLIKTTLLKENIYRIPTSYPVPYTEHFHLPQS